MNATSTFKESDLPSLDNYLLLASAADSVQPVTATTASVTLDAVDEPRQHQVHVKPKFSPATSPACPMTATVSSVNVPASDTDFLASVSNEPRKSVIGQTCQQTLRLARLLGEERRRDVDLAKYANGIVVTKTVESCTLPDATMTKFAEERTYHPPAAEYFKELGF